MYKKLNDFKGDAAWDVLIDIVDPIATIATDEEVKKAFTNKAEIKDFARAVVKNHKAEATKILAALAEKDYETFRNEITVTDILLGVLSILKDREVIDLFLSQGLTTETTSISASETTAE